LFDDVYVVVDVVCVFSDNVYVVVDADVVVVFLMLMLWLMQLLMTASFYSFLTRVDLVVDAVAS